MSRGKKIVLILTIIAAIIGGAYYWLSHMRSELNETVQPMLSDIMESQWNIQMIRYYASPEFSRWIDQNPGFDKELEKFRRLGTIVNNKGIVGFEQNKNAQGETAKVNLNIDFSHSANRGISHETH